MSSPVLPQRARVVVIGGGIIGTSVAYHLAQMGWRDVVLLERDRITSGTTWHAAGLMVTFGSTSETSTEMRKYTRDLYARLEAETGVATGFRPVGFIEVACDPDRLEEYRRVSAFNRFCGVDVHEISAAQVGELFPLARTDDILAGAVRARTEGQLPNLRAIVGFAAETGDANGDVLFHARSKLQRKGCDLLVVNAVGDGKAFEVDVNDGWLLAADGAESALEHGSKTLMASRIADAIAAFLRGKDE